MNEIIVQNQSQFLDIVSKSEVTLAYFTTTHCGVCKVIYPKLLEEMRDFNNTIIKVDGSVHIELASQWLVFTVPTILIFFEGKELLRESRFINMDKITRFVTLYNENT